MGNNTGLIVMGFVFILGLGAVLLLSRKSGDAQRNFDVGLDATGRITITPITPTHQAISFAGGQIFIPGDGVSPGPIITSGSKDFDDIKRFSKSALGTCQCDSRLCCYKGTYQPKRGDVKKERYCEQVYYGDYVDACERVIREFEEETFRVRAMYSNRYGNQLMNTRMAKALS